MAYSVSRIVIFDHNRLNNPWVSALVGCSLDQAVEQAHEWAGQEVRLEGEGADLRGHFCTPDGSREVIIRVQKC